jgi:hypothetical protein
LSFSDRYECGPGTLFLGLLGRDWGGRGTIELAFGRNFGAGRHGGISRTDSLLTKKESVRLDSGTRIAKTRGGAQLGTGGDRRGRWGGGSQCREK